VRTSVHREQLPQPGSHGPVPISTGVDHLHGLPLPNTSESFVSTQSPFHASQFAHVAEVIPETDRLHCAGATAHTEQPSIPPQQSQPGNRNRCRG
jgi:hypothetical protein